MQISVITFHFSLQLKIHVRTKIYSRNVSGINELASVFQFLSTKTSGRNAGATVQCYSNIFRENKNVSGLQTVNYFRTKSPSKIFWQGPKYWK